MARSLPMRADARCRGIPPHHAAAFPLRASPTMPNTYRVQEAVRTCPALAAGRTCPLKGEQMCRALEGAHSFLRVAAATGFPAGGAAHKPGGRAGRNCRCRPPGPCGPSRTCTGCSRHRSAVASTTPMRRRRPPQLWSRREAPRPRPRPRLPSCRPEPHLQRRRPRLRARRSSRHSPVPSAAYLRQRFARRTSGIRRHRSGIGRSSFETRAEPSRWGRSGTLRSQQARVRRPAAGLWRTASRHESLFIAAGLGRVPSGRRTPSHTGNTCPIRGSSTSTENFRRPWADHRVRRRPLASAP